MRYAIACPSSTQRLSPCCGAGAGAGAGTGAGAGAGTGAGAGAASCRGGALLSVWRRMCLTSHLWRCAAALSLASATAAATSAADVGLLSAAAVEKCLRSTKTEAALALAAATAALVLSERGVHRAVTLYSWVSPSARTIARAFSISRQKFWEAVWRTPARCLRTNLSARVLHTRACRHKHVT